MSSTSCPLCEVVSGVRAVPGGLLLRQGGFVLHALAGPSPIPGWVVLTSERHVRAMYSLEDAEAEALGRLAAKVMRAQRDLLKAEHVYAFAIGDQVHHCHLHLVPRYPDTPVHLRGTKCFNAAPEEALAEEALTDAALRLNAALS